MQASVRRLARERDFLETLFNCLQDGLVVMDGQGRIEYSNSSAQRMLGLSSDSAGKLMARYLKEVNWSELLRQPKSNRQTLQINYPEFRVLSLQLVPVDGGLEKPGLSTFAAIFHDVTQEHHAAKAALESEREEAVTLLAAGVAHELGNPLNSLHIHLQLMQRDARKLPPEMAQRFEESIQIAKTEIERLDGIITQFLKAIRPSAPNLIPGNLEVPLRETLALFEAELRNRDIIVECEHPEHLPEVQFDPEQFKQVFYNIIRNALDAMGQAGILKIHFTSDDNFLCVAFADNGGGIAVQHMSQLGQAYFTTKGSSGTGLGLMIVNRIMREHGGSVEIESQTKVGTTVRLKIPLLQKRVRLLENRPTES